MLLASSAGSADAFTSTPTLDGSPLTAPTTLDCAASGRWSDVSQEPNETYTTDSISADSIHAWSRGGSFLAGESRQDVTEIYNMKHKSYLGGRQWIMPTSIVLGRVGRTASK